MIVETVAQYADGLLLGVTVNPFTVIIGRHNVYKAQSSTDYIAIDELISFPIGRTSGFDGVAEQQDLTTQMAGDFTVNFYGDNARLNAVNFMTLHGGQKSYELQRDLGVCIYHVTSFRDLKNIEGSEFKNRFEIEMKIFYNETAVVDTLRIDTAQTTFIVDN